MTSEQVQQVCAAISASTDCTSAVLDELRRFRLKELKESAVAAHRMNARLATIASCLQLIVFFILLWFFGAFLWLGATY